MHAYNNRIIIEKQKNIDKTIYYFMLRREKRK